MVIFGAGGVGSNAVQGARYAGAANVIVIDPVAFKRDNALNFGATHVFASADEAQQAVIELTRGQLADHALITIGVLSAEVVDQAAAIVGKGAQVTITSVGKSAEKQIQLAANGSVVGLAAAYPGPRVRHVQPAQRHPAAAPPVPRRASSSWRSSSPDGTPLDEINQGYQDLDDGKLIRGVILHAS